MVHKKILGTAILATFSLNTSAAVWFENVSGTTKSASVVTSTTVNPATFNTTANFETHTTEKIVVNGVSTEGIIYAAEMFGSGGGIDIPSNATTGIHQAVAYQIDAPIKEDFDLVFTLSNGAKFADALLSIANNDVANDVANDYFCKTNPAYCQLKGTLGNSVTYRVRAKEKPLKSGSILALAYQLTNTGALASAGESIDMTVSFETEIGVKVAAPRTITVAKSAKALGEINILPEDIGTVKISVSSGQTEFIGENPAGVQGAYVSTEEVVLGYIEMKSPDSVPKAQDGITDWKIGEATEAKVNKETTTLTITEGQFAASTAESTGRVYFDALFADGTGFTQDAVVSDVDGKWMAVWQLDDQALSSIATDAAKKVPIKMKVDGSTAINVTENPPVATLSIDFVEDFMADITDISAELRRFRLDGTVCTLYNIPGSNAPDAINVRITNNTNAAGAITIGMWDQEGAELIASGTPLLSDGVAGEDVLPPYATWHISAADLESLSGGAWPGRAMATLSSTISKLEMFALLRHKATGINSSISGGASGNACPDN